MEHKSCAAQYARHILYKMCSSCMRQLCFVIACTHIVNSLPHVIVVVDCSAAPIPRRLRWFVATPCSRCLSICVSFHFQSAKLLTSPRCVNDSSPVFHWFWTRAIFGERWHTWLDLSLWLDSFTLNLWLRYFLDPRLRFDDSLLFHCRCWSFHCCGCTCCSCSCSLFQIFLAFKEAIAACVYGSRSASVGVSSPASLAGRVSPAGIFPP